MYKKCDYCDFLSWKSTEKEREDYVRALEKEIKSYREFAREYRVSTVFFGGGTPSVLTGEQTERILDAVREVFQMEKEPEITLEMNPGTGEMEKLVQYRKMGINRLSIGLQSVKNENLKLLGRIHTYEEFLESCKWAREAGFDNISADLISSLPGQTLDEWKEELEILTETLLEHISVYQLIIEEGTEFYKRYGHREELLPDEETSREIYLWTGKFWKAEDLNSMRSLTMPDLPGSPATISATGKERTIWDWDLEQPLWSIIYGCQIPGIGKNIWKTAKIRKNSGRMWSSWKFPARWKNLCFWV